MSVTKLADGYNQISDATDYHEQFVIGRKLYAFSLQYHDMPTHHYGHRIVYKGGYVAVFDLTTGEVEKIEYPAVSTEENLDEILFVHNEKIYLLLHTSFGTVDIQRIFVWENNVFNEIPFEAPQSETVDPVSRVWFKYANGVTSNGEIVLFGNIDRTIHVYVLKLSEKDASAKLVTSITGDINFLGGTATSGFVSGEHVLVGYAVHGCNYRWERSSFFTVDLANKEVGHISVEGDAPNFCYSGARQTTVLSDGRWAHVTGVVQVGMCGSKYNGTVWALDSAFEGPKWEQINVELPEGSFIDGDKIYLIDKEQLAVGEFHL